jgi:hypothetical protein
MLFGGMMGFPLPAQGMNADPFLLHLFALSLPALGMN